jgi:hypothetical protein
MAFILFSMATFHDVGKLDLTILVFDYRVVQVIKKCYVHVSKDVFFKGRQHCFKL